MPATVAAPIGTPDIISTPPATTTSACPDITAAAPVEMACCDDPHCRSMVKPGTDSGQPAASTAMRPMLPDCWPMLITLPQCTSSTSSGSSAARATSSLSTSADSSTACIAANPPLRLPIGDLTAAVMTASRMSRLPQAVAPIATPC